MSHHPRGTLLLLALLLSAWQLTAQDSRTFQLQDAIDYAWANSFTLKNSQISIADAEEQIVERRAIGLPNISGNVNFQRYVKVPVQVLPEPFVNLIQALNPGEEVNREASFFLKNNFTVALNLDAMVFDGTYFTGLKAARTYREYVQRDLSVKRREVKNNVIDAYLPVMLVNNNLEILDKNIQNLEQLLFETKELYKEGFVEQLDIDRLELSLANLRVERENLQRQKETTLNYLKLTINYPIEQPLEVSGKLEDMSLVTDQTDLNGVIDYSLRPEVNLLDKGIELNDLNIKVNKVGYFPNIRLFGAYQQQYQGNTSEDGFWAPNAYVGLSVNIPIFDGLDRKAKIQRAKLSQETTRLQREEMLKLIYTEVNNARISYASAQKALEAQKRNLNLAQKIYDTTQIKYREGVGSSLEVNQAEQSLYTTQANYIQALYNVIIAKFTLEKAIGK